MSKSIGKILGSAIYSNSNNYTTSYVDKNRGNIIPFTRINNSIGYDLIDKYPKTINLKPTGHTLEDNLKYFNLKKLYKPRLNADNKYYMRHLWENYNQQSLMPYDNHLDRNERTERLSKGNNLFLDIENNPNANYGLPWYTLPSIGNYYINKYSNIIEKYAHQYNVDPNLVKAIMYNEGATGHWGGVNQVLDILGKSGSQIPMNIQGKTWKNFDNRQYDTYNPEQNIELGVQLIKRLQNSIHNPTIEKIATLYNCTGAMEINDYGARTKTIYNQKPWLNIK